MGHTCRGWWRHGGMLVLLCTLVAGLSETARAELQQELVALESQATADPATMPQVEAESLSLAQQYPSPQEAGRIYANLARLYLRTKGQQAKAAEYCRRALECPQDLATQISLHAGWGRALLPRDPSADSATAAQQRRAAVAKCLAALALVATNQTAQHIQQVPEVTPKVASQDPQYQLRLQRHEQEAAARDEVIRQNSLVMWRSALIGACARICRQMDNGRQELERMAIGAGSRPEIVSELLAKYDALNFR